MSNTNKNKTPELQQIYKKKAKKFTYKSIAKELAISSSYVGHIITGRRKCPETIRIKLERILKNEI